MKRCPNCNQTFDDETFFCLDDGTVLEIFNPTFSDAPTQVLQSFPGRSSEQKDSSKSFYVVFAAMTAVIVGLSAIVFFLLSGKDDSAAENKSAPIENPNTVVAQNVSPPVLPMTDEAARSLIARWEKAQDERDFNAYKTCYNQTFFGIKRTKTGGRAQMSYDQWLNDRRKMLRNTIDVGVQNLEITIEGDTAVAQFGQRFQSVNYSDNGLKILRIKMFSEGAKIIYEELKAAY